MEEKRTRLAVWRHGEGRQAAVAALKELVIQHAAFISEKTIDLCNADGFGSWVTNEELTLAKALLKDMHVLDPRGACFRQEDLAQAVEQGLRSAEYSMAVIEKSRSLLCTPSEIFGLIAYKIRIWQPA